MLIHAAVDNDIHPPRFGGAQRSFGLARGLARHHRVRVLCVVPNRNAAPADETCDGVELLRRKAWQTSVAWRLERWGLAPLFAAERVHRANASRYASTLGAGADVLAADLNVAGLLARTDARLRVHTSHNVEADRFAASRPRLLARSRWTERLRRLEREAVERAHLTVVCTDEDAARMRELHGAAPDRLLVIPNGYDETELRPPSAEERARARAALAREGIRLLVAGSVARALPPRRESWLLAAGEVPSLLPVLHAADAGVNPVSAGGGSNVKVPTYLAAGLAVVTTPFGVRGYAPLAPLCVVADADGFADALRGRPRGTATLGEPSPAALVDYAWGRLGERLGERCAALLAGPSGASARGAA